MKAFLKAIQMDKSHSLIIIMLLAGILLVMLAGRSAAIDLLGNAFWIVLILGIVVAIVAVIISALRFARREQAHGRPWLHAFIMYPGIIANFVVCGLAGLGYVGNVCGSFHDCLQSVPLWWLPISVIAFGGVILFFEKLLLKMQQPSSE
jgi:hypothetical protein